MAKLSVVPTGSLVMIEEIPTQESLYKILMAYGIYRGTQIKILRNDRWQDMILSEVDGKRVAIRKRDVASIDVTVIRSI